MSFRDIKPERRSLMALLNNPTKLASPRFVGKSDGRGKGMFKARYARAINIINSSQLNEWIRLANETNFPVFTVLCLVLLKDGSWQWISIEQVKYSIKQILVLA